MSEPAARAPLAWVVAGTTAIVAALGLIVELLHHTTDVSESLVTTFSLSFEGNVPTWYASILLFSCALVVASIAREAPRDGGFRRRWWLLAALFLYISIDETATLHERLNDLVHLGGALRFGWIVPAGVVVIGLGIAYLPFLAALPKRIRTRVVLAGILYVGGALVMELPLGWWVDRVGESDGGTGYALIDFVEEALELAGATLFFVTMLELRSSRRAAQAGAL